MIVYSSIDIRQSEQARDITDSVRDDDDLLEKCTTCRWNGQQVTHSPLSTMQRASVNHLRGPAQWSRIFSRRLVDDGRP